MRSTCQCLRIDLWAVSLCVRRAGPQLRGQRSQAVAFDEPGTWRGRQRFAALADKILRCHQLPVRRPDAVHGARTPKLNFRTVSVESLEGAVDRIEIAL